MELRDYQRGTIDKMLWGRRLGGNSIITAPQGCLAKNTPILMADGTYKEVYNIKRGEKVVSYDNYSEENTIGTVDNVFRTSLRPKPMIELDDGKEILKVTYDHPFFNGERFYPLYQLVWRKLEASQKIQLKLLCQQYGADFNHTLSRGLQSCCNDTCPRCQRISQDSYEWENDQSTQNSSRELVGEPTETSSNKPLERQKGRQPSGKLRVVYCQIQRMDWTQDWKNQNSREQQNKAYSKLGRQGLDKELLLNQHGWSEWRGKEETLSNTRGKISPRFEKEFTKMGNWRIRIKQAEPYYSICLREAPYTYYIGKKRHFVTHNSGKSVIIAHFAKELGRRILILQPNKEILEQNVAKLKQYVDESEIGVYSASVGKKTIGFYTFATIGSIYKRQADFEGFRTIIIDECSQLNPKDIETMYMKFLSKLHYPKVYGLTATPYRMDKRYEKVSFGGYADTVHTTKMINRMANKGEKPFWNRMLHVIQVGDILKRGYLSPLEYHIRELVDFDEIPLNKSHSDFDLDAYEELIEPKMKGIVNSIQEIVATHNSTVVFCSSVRQAERLAEVFLKGRAVSATTPPRIRNKIIEQFRTGEVRLIFNVNILSYGFDHPSLDSIVLLRPTKSMAWHLQALGRGMRIAEGKTKCDVYDYSGNVSYLGKAESLKIVKLDDGWNVETDKGLWHNRELYRFRPKPKWR